MGWYTQAQTSLTPERTCRLCVGGAITHPPPGVSKKDVQTSKNVSLHADVMNGGRAQRQKVK